MDNNVREAQKIMIEMLQVIHDICKKNSLEYFLDWGTLLGAIRHKGFIPWDDDVDISMPRADYEKFKVIAQKEFGEKYFLQTPETDREYKYYYMPMKVRHLNSKYVEIVESGQENFKNGIYIDIFPLDKLQKNKFKLKLEKMYKFIMERTPLLWMDKKEFSMQRRVIYPFVYIFINCTSIGSRKKIDKWFYSKGKKEENIYVSGVELYFSQLYNKEDIYPLREIEFEGKNFMAPNKPENILKSLYNDYMELPPVEKRFSHAKKIEIYESGYNM